MTFGTQQQIRTTMTVTWSNVEIFKIQNGGRPPCSKNIRNAITRLPMDNAYHQNWDATSVVTSHHAPDMSAMMRLPWQRPLPTDGALNILQLWASGSRTREPISTKFGTHRHVRAAMTVTWSIIVILKLQKADGRHVGKYWEYHNSPSNGPVGTKLGWSFPSCPPKWGCHGIGRCLAMGLATALWTFSSYGCLEAERMNQFW